MGNTLLGPAVMGIARHVLTAAGGYLVAKGVLDDGTATELVGAGVTIVGVIWSLIDKRLR